VSFVDTFVRNTSENTRSILRTKSTDFATIAQELAAFLKKQQVPSLIIVPIDVRDREYRDLQREVQKILREENYRVALARAPFQLMSEFGGAIKKPRLNAGGGTRKKYSAMKPEIVIADCRHDSLENYLEDLSANSRIAYDAYDMSEQIRVVFVSPTETINYDRFDCPVMEFTLTASFERAAFNSENPGKLIEEIGKGTELGELLNCVITAGVWHTRLPKTLLERILACDSQTLDKLLRSGREYGLAEVDQNDLDTACISFADSSIPEQCWPQLASSIPMADLIRKILRTADPCVRAERVTILALLTRIATRGKYLVQYGLGTADFSRWLKDNRVDLQRLIFAPDCNGNQKFICERSEAIAWMRLFVDTYQFDEAMQIATALDISKSYSRQFLCLQYELLFRWALADAVNRKKIQEWLPQNSYGQIELDRENIGKHLKLSRYHLALSEYQFAWESADRAISEVELMTVGESSNLHRDFMRWRAIITKASISLEWPERTFEEVDDIARELTNLMGDSVPACFKRRFSQELSHLCAKRHWYGGDTAQALGQIEEILKANPRDFVAMSFRGLIQRHSSEFDAARHSFEQVLAICPDNHYGLLGLGETYAEMGRRQNVQGQIEAACACFSDAIRIFDSILDMHRGHVPALVAAALVEMDHASVLTMQELNDPASLTDSSKRRLARALRLEPTNQRALVSLANWHIQFSDAASYNSFRDELRKKQSIRRHDPIWLAHDLMRLRRACLAESISGLDQRIQTLEYEVRSIIESQGQKGAKPKYSAATCRMLRQMKDSRGSVKPFDI
jgi:tetratricopeptide (TPR) repeat protein